MQSPCFRASVLALGALAALGLPACGDDDDLAPTITRFEISALTVDRGDRVTITYQVTGADTVEIAAQPGSLVLAPTSELSGMVQSAALNANTTFVISAKNAAGTTSNSKQVTVRAAPGQVSIDSFDASPTSVEVGGTSVLSWETSNASAVGISTAEGVEVLPAGTELTGTLQVSPTPPATTYVLTAEGTGGPVTRSVQITVIGAPSITDFTATPSAIVVGESSLLEWTAQNVDAIEIRDPSGNLVHENTSAAGSYEVTPPATTTYTLLAKRAGFPDASDTVTVTVNPIEGAVITSFTATPEVLQNIGESSVLAWVVSNARGIEVEARGLTVFTSSAATGSFTVTPTQTTDYTLWARNTLGDASAVARVTLNPSAPAITNFSAAPNPVLVGQRTNLSWSTLGADEVRVLSAGDTLFQNASDQVAAGVFAVTVTSTGPHVFTLEAENANDVNRASVTVVGALAPVIDAFDVDPTVFYGTSVTATVTWSTSLATEVELFADGLAVVGFPTTSTTGVFSLLVTGTTLLELVARNAVAETTSATLVSSIFDKLEPNDTSSTAIALTGDGSGVRGSIGVAGDVDYYVVTVPDGSYLQVWTNGGSPDSCLIDTFLDLYGPDGTTQLGGDDDDGFNVCSDIAPSRDVFVRNLSAGQYYIRVRHYAAAGTGEYFLYARVETPVCGNGALESAGGEECDDGNLVTGDGCTSECRVEPQPLGTVAGPGASQSFSGAIVFPGTRDFYQIDLAADGIILAETFVPVVGRCDTNDGSPSADTVIRLYDANLVELGSDDEGGIASCSRIDEFSLFNNVPAGTYFISVEDFGNNTLIDAYVLQVQTLGLGCGNGIIEAGEECDDGNPLPGDGCTALCGLEGAPEAEPNANAGEATSVGVTPGSPVIMGAELPAADIDFFSVVVPAGHSIDAMVTVGSLSACPANLQGLELALIGPNGTTVLGTGAGACPRVWPYTVTAAREMAAGTYYLRVRKLDGAALPSNYFLHVTLIAPACGNGIFETGEQCDDGNQADGDGCSSACVGEIAQSYSGPGAAATIPGSITPAQGRRFYEVELTAEAYLVATAYAPTVGSCVGTALRLELFDDAFASLGSAASGTPEVCASIDPLTHAFARQPAGTYYLRVEELGNDATVPAYELVLEARPVDVCGNAVREAGEQCDDGGLVSGDGCDLSCQIEVAGVITGPTASQVFDLSIPVPDDFEVIRVEMSAAGSLTAFTGVPAIGTCTSSTGAGETADTRVFLLDETLSVQIAANDDTGGTACSRIQGAVLAPGVYHLVVDSFFNDRTISALQLQVDLAPAVCGNSVVDFGEQCDDGNAATGDGCDDLCAFEVDGTLSGPGPTPAGVSTVFATSLPVATGRRIFEIDVTADSYFSASTGVPAIGTCTAAGGETNDTEIRLTNDQGVQIALNDQFGGTNCSALANVSLAAGTYFLDVHAWQGINVISALEVAASLVPENVCGNGVTEAGAAEACDDGNVTDGDGCDSLCQVEGADIQVSTSAGLAIPDNAPTGVTSALQVPATPVCAIASVRVPINITHTWRGDLIVDLTSPLGTTVRLHNRTGGSADDLVGAFGIDLVPAEPLTTLVGEDPAGDWNLTVSDNAGADTGTLNDWGLLITCQ